MQIVAICNQGMACELSQGVADIRGEHDACNTADKFIMVHLTASLNFTELRTYCGERGLFPMQVERSRQSTKVANKKRLLTLKVQKEREKLCTKNQRQNKNHTNALQHGRRP